jgi:hypothetical protein
LVKREIWGWTGFERARDEGDTMSKLGSRVRCLRNRDLIPPEVCRRSERGIEEFVETGVIGFGLDDESAGGDRDRERPKMDMAEILRLRLRWRDEGIADARAFRLMLEIGRFLREVDVLEVDVAQIDERGW